MLIECQPGHYQNREPLLNMCAGHRHMILKIHIIQESESRRGAVTHIHLARLFYQGLYDQCWVRYVVQNDRNESMALCPLGRCKYNL